MGAPGTITEDTAMAETPAEETPADGAPAEEVPVEETPADNAPAKVVEESLETESVEPEAVILPDEPVELTSAMETVEEDIVAEAISVVEDTGESEKKRCYCRCCL